MIERVKQKVRECLTAKYDREYTLALDSRCRTYDQWRREKRNVRSRRTEDEETKQNGKKAVLISYSELSSMAALTEYAALPEDAKVVILTEDKELTEGNVIERIVDIFEKHPQIQVIYGDEDELNSNGTVHLNPWLKPEFSPDTLLSYFYFGSMVAFRRQCLQEAVSRLKKRKQELGKEKVSQGESFREVRRKKLLYALVLEACTVLNGDEIFHEKEILFSSHCITLWGFEEEYRQIREFYDLLREREEVNGISVVIPSKDHPGMLAGCLEALYRMTEGTVLEVIVVDNGSREDNREKIQALEKEYGFLYLYEPMEFNFSKMCSKGASRAKYDLLLFLNDDCEIRNRGCLSHMAALAAVKKTGAVGAKLYYPESKKIQHCGIYNTCLGPVHKLQFKDDNKVYYDRRNRGVRNVLAVTGACLMIRKSVYESAGGFDEELRVAFNDVDLCYRLYEKGYYNVTDNEVYLWHHESLSRGSDDSPVRLRRLMGEKKKLYEKHKALWERDPYYHPEFTADILDTGYSFAYEYPSGFFEDAWEGEKPRLLEGLPKGCREDACVALTVEYAGEPAGWFLEENRVQRLEKQLQTKDIAYLQGTAVVLGSDNACFEKKLLLYHKTAKTWWSISPCWRYRPDVAANMPDQKNAALSGFSCLADMSLMPSGNYRLGVMARDRISGQTLFCLTAAEVEKKEAAEA